MRPELAPFQQLELRDLRLNLRLGVGEAERARPQPVSLTVTFRFAKAPAGMTSDSLAGTICYAELGDALERHFSAGEWSLIERVAGDAYGIARELARGGAGVAVRAHKLYPPLKGLEGGAVYTCGDFAP